MENSAKFRPTTWNLASFRRMFKSMGRKTINYKDAEGNSASFQLLVFHPESGADVEVSFAKGLGELNNAQLRSQLADLQVLKGEDGSYHLCKQGVIEVEEDLW